MVQVAPPPQVTRFGALSLTTDRCRCSLIADAVRCSLPPPLNAVTAAVLNDWEIVVRASSPHDVDGRGHGRGRGLGSE